MKTSRTHSEFLKALLLDERLLRQHGIIQQIYDQLFYPDFIQDALDRIQELSSDIGFMGSPEYNRLREEVDDFMAARAEKEKANKEYEEYIRLKEKFEGPFVEGVGTGTASTRNFNHEDERIVSSNQLLNERKATKVLFTLIDEEGIIPPKQYYDKKQ